MTKKYCNKCGENKICDPDPLVSEFAKSKYSPGGYRYACKDCDNKRARGKRAEVAAKLGRPIRDFVPRRDVVPTAEIEIEVDATGVEERAASSTALEPAPPPPPPDPLQEAYKYRNQAKEKRDLKREHSALADENDKLRREIAEIRNSLRPHEVIVYKQASWERSDAVSVALASDWHVEEPVDPAAVHGLNEYNEEIAKSRAEHFFANWLRLTDIHARESKINTMFLGALGDFFSGWIHDELMAATSMAPGDASRFVKSLLIAGIDFLLRESSYVIDGVMIPGNHGRMTKRIHSSDPTGTSLETVMYEALADHYRGNDRVRLEVSDHAMRYRAFFEKYKIRFIHGYEIKYQGGVGGITIPINKALAQWNNPIIADLTCMGHWHQFFDGGNFFVNGSLIGYSPFSQFIKAKYEPPQQSFFLIHARNGGEKSVVAPIWLEDPK